MFIKILILLSNTRQGPFSVTGIHVWKLQDIQNGKWYKTNPDKGWPFFSLYLPRSFCPPVVWGFFLFIWLCSVSVVVHWISDLRWCIRDLCSTGDLVPWPGIEPGSPALGTWSLSHWTTREVPGQFIFSWVWPTSLLAAYIQFVLLRPWVIDEADSVSDFRTEHGAWRKPVNTLHPLVQWWTHDPEEAYRNQCDSFPQLLFEWLVGGLFPHWVYTTWSLSNHFLTMW